MHPSCAGSLLSVFSHTLLRDTLLIRGSSTAGTHSRKKEEHATRFLELRGKKSTNDSLSEAFQRKWFFLVCKKAFSVASVGQFNRQFRLWVPPVLEP